MLKENITSLLRERNNYEPSDEALIDQIIFNAQLIEECKNDIKTRGCIVVQAGRKLAGMTSMMDRTNNSLGIMEKLVSQNNVLYTKLGISPQERIKLQLKKEESDGFDDDDE